MEIMNPAFAGYARDINPGLASEMQAVGESTQNFITDPRTRKAAKIGAMASFLTLTACSGKEDVGEVAGDWVKGSINSFKSYVDQGKVQSVIGVAGASAGIASLAYSVKGLLTKEFSFGQLCLTAMEFGTRGAIITQLVNENKYLQEVYGSFLGYIIPAAFVVDTIKDFASDIIQSRTRIISR